MELKRLTRIGVLTAIALTIFMIEAQLPAPVPIPGVKLGLANVIILYAVFTLGAKDALAILLCRIFLGSVFAGQMMTLVYSFCGGMLCFACVVLLSRILQPKQIWLCGVLGAVMHNVGQLGAAIAIVRTPELISYLPILTITGIVTGCFTGTCAQQLIHRLPGPAHPHCQRKKEFTWK